MKLSEMYKKLKERDKLLERFFDKLSTIITIRVMQLKRTISATQVLSTDIEYRMKKLMQRHHRLLIFVNEYRAEEELRSMIDLDHQELRRKFIEVKEKVDNILTKENLKEGKEETVEDLEDFSNL